MQINVKLRKNLKKATVFDSNLFPSIKHIAMLKKPNHLIIKPIFAAMVMIKTFPKTPPDMDWHG